jgi:hypothetical protein
MGNSIPSNAAMAPQRFDRAEEPGLILTSSDDDFTRYPPGFGTYTFQDLGSKVQWAVVVAVQQDQDSVEITLNEKAA